MKIRFASNNKLIRDCIISSLRATDICISETAEDDEATSEDLVDNDVLFIFVAIGLKDLLELISSREQEVMKIASTNKVIIITDVEEGEYIRKSMLLGVNGYITMNLGFEIVMPVIRMICAGGSFIPAHCFLSAKQTIYNSKQVITQDKNLTDRQIEILSFLKQGKKSKDIASMLSISESTVGVHVMNIMRKLGIKKRNEMMSVHGIMNNIPKFNALHL
ncbi:hypothetical protein C5L14_19285 [Labrys okinawensis]|uniref:HTH luxR-type domain-containing protein n=1 Tax=Labrys okinawensis TaxID=346911 RepID=A0A2S9Q8M5_9HYPH|nr:response regulator transcription factor [Labrys okinawensis]PRH85708.1 hypothetical protein C5L14_19285 [Labrys okinawensis]